ncbi:DUF6320 domain-containing protein [Aminipila sp.]|uniref:DUF6320 domain-containing protein n=1 Tax=Aminipila sp. TaxID=2060095 RepID=UPI00289C4F12|nr:DUF6320 domain-containing protein [Aminipila sp.]
MLYCEHCKIEVTGIHQKCPLCHCNLTGEPENNLPQYPMIRNQTSKIYLIFNLMKLTAIVACVISILVNYITYKETLWSIFVVAGFACGWLLMAIGIKRKANLIKLLQWELYITCGLTALWDYFTGWHGWSIEFVLPCTCIVCMILIYILSALLKKEPKEYLIYLTLVNILGFFPILFLILGWLEIELPSVLCIGCSTLFLMGIFLFKRQAAYGEFKKKLHI